MSSWAAPLSMSTVGESGSLAARSKCSVAGCSMPAEAGDAVFVVLSCCLGKVPETLELPPCSET